LDYAPHGFGKWAFRGNFVVEGEFLAYARHGFGKQMTDFAVFDPRMSFLDKMTFWPTRATVSGNEEKISSF
jgi:hypothetical protein